MAELSSRAGLRHGLRPRFVEFPSEAKGAAWFDSPTARHLMTLFACVAAISGTLLAQSCFGHLFDADLVGDE
jgi:hypothetical protein